MRFTKPLLRGDSKYNDQETVYLIDQVQVKTISERVIDAKAVGFIKPMNNCNGALLKIYIVKLS